MSILVAAVEAGSLSAAARRTGTPLATVSRKVSELEAALKTRLLHRSSRRLTLTDAGRDYVAACRRILEQVREAERAAAGEFVAPRGHLVLGAPIVFGRLHLLPIVTAFLAAYPEIDLRLALADRMVNLVEEHVDAALRIGALADSNMTAIRVGEIRRVVCGSPAYLKAHGRPGKPSDLEGHHCITFEGLQSPSAWLFPARRGTQAVPIHSRLVVNTAEAAVDAAVAGVGLTRVFSYQVAAALAAGKIELVLEAFEPSPSPVHLVHAGAGLLPLKLRAFLDFAVPRLRAVLSADIASGRIAGRDRDRGH
jgi:DNA-binding transcriptional LysR family regulator